MSSGTSARAPAVGNIPESYDLSFKVLYDGSGVPTVHGEGIRTVVDGGTGLFTITTTFKWILVLGGGHIRLSASASGGALEMVSNTPSTGTLAFRCTNAAGAAADPANGDGFLVTVKLKRVGITTPSTTV